MSADKTQYKIGSGTKTWMLLLALIFDGIQFVTPGMMDSLVTAVAVLVFGMVFAEKGALTVKGSNAIKIFRLLVPFAEVFISHIPGISLAVWLQIKMSRLGDNVLPEIAKEVLRAKKLGQRVRGRTFKKDLKKVTGEVRRLKKYGKGRRGQRTLHNKERGAEAKTLAKQRRLQNSK